MSTTKFMLEKRGLGKAEPLQLLWNTALFAESRPYACVRMSAKGGMVLERRLLIKDHQGRVAEKAFLLVCWQLACWVRRACREQEWQIVQGRKQGKPELTTVSYFNPPGDGDPTKEARVFTERQACLAQDSKRLMRVWRGQDRWPGNCWTSTKSKQINRHNGT